MAVTGNEPVSTSQLKLAIDGVKSAVGGGVLFESSDGAKNGNLSSSAADYTVLLVSYQVNLSSANSLSTTAVMRNGEGIRIEDYSRRSCYLTVRGTSFSMSDQSVSARVFKVVGLNLS